MERLTGRIVSETLNSKPDIYRKRIRKEKAIEVVPQQFGVREGSNKEEWPIPPYPVFVHPSRIYQFRPGPTVTTLVYTHTVYG